MHKITAWLATTPTAVTLVGPAIAADAPPTSRTSAPEPSKGATPKTMRTRHLAAEIVSVDQGGRTVTVKHGLNAKETTFAVDNQGQMTAKTITGHNHIAKH